MTTVNPALSVPPPRVLMPQLDWPGLSERARALGLALEYSPYGPEFSAPQSKQLPEQLARVFALPDYAAITLSGPDTQTFLQGQLTNDVAALAIGDTQLSGYCTAKGRLLATGWLSRTAEQDYLWVVSSPLVQALCKRLKMYVMRAKVQVQSLSDTHLVLGLHRFPTLASNEVGLIPLRLRLPQQQFGEGSCLLVVAQEALLTTWQSLGQHGAVGASQEWRAIEIQAGLARITSPTSELFVPQMVNFELTGGVSFKKGCYPGQEIVARSQYLGKLKRRMLIASFDGESLALPAADVWLGLPGKTEAIGQIVMSARSGPHNVCLVEAGEVPAEAQLWTQLPSGDPLRLVRQELPYAIEKIA
jgi:tRNA-modifying protein YgfZ